MFPRPQSIKTRAYVPRPLNQPCRGVTSFMLVRKLVWWKPTEMNRLRSAWRVSVAVSTANNTTRLNRLHLPGYIHSEQDLNIKGDKANYLPIVYKWIPHRHTHRRNWYNDITDMGTLQRMAECHLHNRKSIDRNQVSWITSRYTSIFSQCSWQLVLLCWPPSILLIRVLAI